MLTTTALGIAIAVITVQVLSDHTDLVTTAMRLGGAALLAIAGALLCLNVPARPPTPVRATRPLPRR